MDELYDDERDFGDQGAEDSFELQDYDEPDVDEVQENEDFAHDGYFDNIEDGHLDGMYEE